MFQCFTFFPFVTSSETILVLLCLRYLSNYAVFHQIEIYIKFFLCESDLNTNNVIDDLADIIKYY